MTLKKIECIGEGGPRARPYGIWEVKGFGGALFSKHELQPQKSYAEANSVGSRGVFAYYLLQRERIYEVLEPVSWNRDEHYYMYLEGDEEVRGTVEDAFRWVKNATSA